MNRTEAAKRNKKELCELLTLAKQAGNLTEEYSETGEEVYLLRDETGDTLALMDKKTGMFLNTEAGKNKSNHRQHFKISLPSNPNYGCTCYAFKIICDALLDSKIKGSKMKYMKYSLGIMRGVRVIDAEQNIEEIEFENGVINHINGDTECNISENLEVDTQGMNNAHARLMQEVNYYFPNLVEVRGVDCQGNKMYRWVDGIGVSCQDIRKWNYQFKDGDSNIIRSRKDKKGEWQSHYTKEQVTAMLKFFGKNPN